MPQSPVLLTELGRHYRSLRRARDLTQIDLTVATGIGQQVISSFERRGVIPTRLRTLEELGRLIGADQDALELTLAEALPRLQAARHPIAREVVARLKGGRDACAQVDGGPCEVDLV